MLVPVAALLPDAPTGSFALRALFAALSLIVASLFPVAVYRSALAAHLPANTTRRQVGIALGVTTLWLAGTLIAANVGLLRFNPAPPTIVIVLVGTLLLAIRISFSTMGRQMALHIPLGLLIGYQGFRVLVELLLHQAYREGLMPVQMSYSGRNFDIVSGITAILMMIWIARGGRPSSRVVFLWNTLGLALLLNVLTVAMLSAPLPFRVFMNEPSNVWITHAPWVWLPAVLVLAALTGHLLVYRRLTLERRTSQTG